MIPQLCPFCNKKYCYFLSLFYIYNVKLLLLRKHIKNLTGSGRVWYATHVKDREKLP